MKAPTVSIDPQAFWKDPYPALATMRRETPVCFVPELGAILFTRRDDISTCEKEIDIFSSHQPGGLMNQLMGHNMMRKDGDAHFNERKQAFPALSPRTVRDHWRAKFEFETAGILDGLKDRNHFDLVQDFALPVSGHALRHITGLTNLSPYQMDAVSQGMMDGIANYAGDPNVEAKCHEATALIDSAIDERLQAALDDTACDMLSVLTRTDQPMDSIRANIKLAISGGQNEPRDAIAGTAWALLTHPDQLANIRSGDVPWLKAFEEYARWISPIGMSPRRVAKAAQRVDVDLEPEDRVFFMFGSGNRDESVFEEPEIFNIHRDLSKSIAFGAGPHFCAGAAASRVLIGDVALPMLMEAFPDLAIAGDVPFGGWAFRGPLSCPVSKSAAL